MCGHGLSHVEVFSWDIDIDCFSSLMIFFIVVEVNCLFLCLYFYCLLLFLIFDPFVTPLRWWVCVQQGVLTNVTWLRSHYVLVLPVGLCSARSAYQHYLALVTLCISFNFSSDLQFSEIFKGNRFFKKIVHYSRGRKRQSKS